MIDRYNDAADDVIKNQDKYWSKISLLYCIQEIGVQVVGIMLLMPLYLGYLVLVKQSITAGDFVATFNGAYSIAVSINFLTVWAVARFEERAKIIEKYRGFLNAESKITDGENHASVTEPKEIKIENMSFTYPGILILQLNRTKRLHSSALTEQARQRLQIFCSGFMM